MALFGCCGGVWEMRFLHSLSIPQDPSGMALLPLSVPAPLQGTTANPITEAPGIILLPYTGFLPLKQSRDEISIFSLSCYASF